MDEKPNIDVELPAPWHWLSEDFETELYRELPVGHKLEGKSLKTIARRQDLDDFLFAIANSDFEYAIVHLTWKKEKTNPWPVTELYRNWLDVYENQILPDSVDFN